MTKKEEDRTPVKEKSQKYNKIETIKGKQASHLNKCNKPIMNW